MDERPRVEFFDEWQRVVEALCGVDFSALRSLENQETFTLDYHTHGIRVTDAAPIQSASAVRLENVFLDWWIALATELDCEIVYNSPAGRAFGTMVEEVTGSPHRGCRPDALAATEAVVAERLPDYLSIAGPYHPCLEELRSSTFVEDYRRSISDLLIKGEDVGSAVTRLEEEAKKYEREVFEKYLTSYRRTSTYARAIIGDVAGMKIPGSGTLLEIWEQVRIRKERRRMGWAGFFLDVKQLTAESQ